MIAHNCSFDYPRLISNINKYFLKEHFKTVVHEFCHTIPVIKEITGKKGKGDNKLENLANKLEISSEGAHNAIQDVLMLQEIIKRLNISEELLKKKHFLGMRRKIALTLKITYLQQ